MYLKIQDIDILYNPLCYIWSAFTVYFARSTNIKLKSSCLPSYMTMEDLFERFRKTSRMLLLRVDLLYILKPALDNRNVIIPRKQYVSPCHRA